MCVKEAINGLFYYFCSKVGTKGNARNERFVLKKLAYLIL